MEIRENKGANELFQYIRSNGPKTRKELEEHSKLSERTITNYLNYLRQYGMIKELPTFGRAKKYATIDYVPVLDETRPLEQRWQVFVPATNTRYTLGELATYYGNGVPSSSLQAAELLFKAPALMVYYAQENELSEEQKNVQLEALKIVCQEACDQLQSAISVLINLIHDPRLWRSDLLEMFRASPDYVLNSELPKIIERLREESEQDEEYPTDN